MRRNGKFVVHDLDLSTGLRIGLQAENIRQQATGTHARVTILLDQRPVSWDTFNVERESDRIHLTGSAWRRLEAVSGVKDDLTRARLQLILDDFCHALWPCWTQRLAPQLVGDDDDVQPLQMVLDPYIVEGGGTIFFAPPGRGKSYLGLAMAVAIDAGVGDLWNVRRTRTAYLNLERSPLSFNRRLKLVNVSLGLPLSRQLWVTNARGWSLSDVVDGLEASIEEQGIGCVWVDSLSRAGFGDLTENRVGNAIMDSLNALGVTWCVIGHPPRADESHVYGCHDAETEVLTRDGWRRFSEWREGESVLTLRQDGKKSEFQYEVPLALHSYPFVGELIEIDTPSAHARVTPNHRMFVKDKAGTARWIEARSLPAEVQIPTARAVRQGDTRRYRTLRGFPIEQLARILGIIISEGSTGSAIQIAQASKNAQPVRDALDCLGWRYKERRVTPSRARDIEEMSYFRLSEPQPGFFRWLRGQVGMGAKQKRLPESWQRWPKIAQRALFESLMWGDGHWETPNFGVYSTASPRLASDIQVLAMSLGFLTRVTHRPTGYAVSIWKQRRWRWLTKRRHVRTIPYDGQVYCFTMPSGFLVTRRGGRTFVSGNSQMFDAAADVIVQVLSQLKDDGTLGVGLKVTKANDIKPPPMAIYALEFDQYGLAAIRWARDGEFPTIEAQKTQGMAEQIHDYLLDIGKDDATSISKELGFNRQNVSELLNHDRTFRRVGRDGRRVLFAVQSDQERS